LRPQLAIKLAGGASASPATLLRINSKGTTNVQNNADDRVLSKGGAREITRQELDSVHAFNTFVCTVNFTTGAKDGDACH
jgi:hypothetical protein